MSEQMFDKDRLKEAMGDMAPIDLAIKLGCTKSSISMYLSGQRIPSKMAIQLIALVLGVNPAWLCGLDVPKLSNAKIISIENAPTKTDERVREFTELFSKLSPEIQEMMIAQIKGILASQES